MARHIAESGIDPVSRADVMALRSAILGAGTPQGSAYACGFTDIDSSPEP